MSGPTTSDNVPLGTTHKYTCYGETLFYKKVTFSNLNQVSEAWESRVRWYFWTGSQWFPEYSGFSDRNLRPI